jgi:hypothetical protein
MTRADIQTNLRLPYDRQRWSSLLKALLPETQVEARPPVIKDEINDPKQKVQSAHQIAIITLADGRRIAVIEARVSGSVDLERNRVGLRNFFASFIDQERAHAVLGLSHDGSSESYRLSFVARSSDIAADGQLTRSETDRRRYTYLLGRSMACRTAAQRLDQLQAKGTAARLNDFLDAFKVEPLFKEFFKDYRRVFEQVRTAVSATFTPAPGDKDKDPLQMFTQRLFNRLMFLAFIERKGWLKIGNRTDYLAALWESRATGAKANFYRDHLVPLFFEGLNQPDRPAAHTDPRFGSVPYLNGGLFEKAEHGYDADDSPIVIPDDALAAILDASDSDDSRHGLFARYNFTAAESTPLDVEVAVDPEMLGKVFEELVTGRNETGSFYTPKPIVSFMCREALVGHLASQCGKEDRSALEAFIHEHKADLLRDPEAVLAALRTVTVCDPACGSGAYLLGMLHELLELRRCLFSSNQKLDGVTAHARKLEIIERNLYGVDKDAFAVGIARLRLWLSLAVEYDGATPPPALPNLDFKIEQGDSLAAPAPAEVLKDAGDLPILLPTVRQFAIAKSRFLTEHGEKKAVTRQEIIQLKSSLKTWLSTDGPPDAFHWAIEFAEVFLPSTPTATLAGEFSLVNGAQKQQELLIQPSTLKKAQGHGFDIVVANPPYVRQELISAQKPLLKKRFKKVFSGVADLFVFFYARAHDLLRDGGTAAFISSNKWLRAGYGELLRQQLLDAQAFGVVMDFGDLPVFESATAYPCIFIWSKQARGQSATRWAMVRDLDRCYAEGVRTHFNSLVVSVPAKQFGKGGARLATSVAAGFQKRMSAAGPKLVELYGKQMFNGVKSGLIDAFVIDSATRDSLIDEHASSAHLIRPFLDGDDVRKFEIEGRNRFLLYIRWDTEIEKFPAILRHLRSFDGRLKKRDGVKNSGHCPWYALSRPRPEAEIAFGQPKIIYPDIGKSVRFAMDEVGLFCSNTTYFIGVADWYLLAVLNSASVSHWLEGSVNDLRGGYLRFFGQHMEQIPIPAANDADRATVGSLAQQAQGLHTMRRARVEQFLRELGLDPAQSTSRNPLEQPWSLPPAEFLKRSKPLQRSSRAAPQHLYEAARDETAALTAQIAQLEAEIDARVATLYGLDAEDQRWAAKAAPAAQPDDKSTLFFRILGSLKERSPYFTHKAIQTAINDAELGLKDEALNVYLHQAVKQGIIHDAGRGWYSRLSEPVKLDVQHVAKLVKTVEKTFPLLDFTVWSTAQINPWMHHLLAQPVTFLHAKADTLESVGDALRALGWDVAVNPKPSVGPASVRPGSKMVVLRPSMSKQPTSEGRQAPVEKIIVDLIVESQRLALMDISEAQGVAAALVNAFLIQIPVIQRYAASRVVEVAAIESIN